MVNKLNFVDDGAYFAHLSTDYHLAYIARVGPGRMTGRWLSNFFGDTCRRPFWYNLFISLNSRLPSQRCIADISHHPLFRILIRSPSQLLVDYQTLTTTAEREEGARSCLILEINKLLLLYGMRRNGDVTSSANKR